MAEHAGTKLDSPAFNAHAACASYDMTHDVFIGVFDLLFI
jgi:hypothetical protein